MEKAEGRTLQINILQKFFFSRRDSPLVDLGLLLIHEDFCGVYITYNDTPQSVGLLWASDQLVAETSTRQHTTFTTDKQPCPPVGFEPTISAGERL